MMKCLGIMLIAVLLVIVPGYGDAQSPVTPGTLPVTQPESLKGKGEPEQAGKSFTSEEKAEYQKKVAMELAEVEKRLDTLKAKSEKATQQKKRTFLRVLVDLQKKTIAVQNKLEALKDAPENAWSGIKADLDKAMTAVANACTTAEAHLK